MIQLRSHKTREISRITQNIRTTHHSDNKYITTIYLVKPNSLSP